jgi:hypothetical protein
MNAIRQVSNLPERLNKLERQNRQLTLILVSLLVVGGLVLLSAAQKTKPQSGDTEKLVLRDGAGKERARLEMGKHGPLLQFFDDRGRPLASMGTSQDALVLRLFNTRGRLQTGVALEQDGVALVNVDRDGQLQRGRGALLITNGGFDRE